MDISHPDHPRDERLTRGLAVKADVRLDVLASVAAALVTGLSTYVFLRAARAVMEGDKVEVEVEVEAAARRAHQPLTEPIP